MAETNATASEGASRDDRPHKPADDRETIYFEGSPLMRGELGKMFLCALIAAGLIAGAVFLYRRQRDTVPIWALAIMIGVAVLLLFVPYVLTRMRRYRISNYRIDYERGLLSKRIDTLELWHVDDISFQQGLLDRVFNVGKVTIISNDKTTPRLELDGLPNPRPIFDSLKQRIIAVKRQRGVIKMDVG
jgi:membrane protein YdbS with pleckstrin-like domain